MSPPILTQRDLGRATLARQGLLEPLAISPVQRLVGPGAFSRYPGTD